ncbi:hypothetical protein [Neisseria bacilliformis]|uniref:hypothetical protein n=1 Tax=Neisseria bacilliformis TaxID=267212 RepID=UPI0028EC8A15|nr:hypothetical protein [Neisseria bacilliformis]
MQTRHWRIAGVLGLDPTYLGGILQAQKPRAWLAPHTLLQRQKRPSENRITGFQTAF